MIVKFIFQPEFNIGLSLETWTSSYILYEYIGLFCGFVTLLTQSSIRGIAQEYFWDKL